MMSCTGSRETLCKMAVLHTYAVLWASGVWHGSSRVQRMLTHSS